MNRKELNSKIPYGYGKVIAAKAGVTPAAVYNFLRGKTNSYKIEKAALEIAAELSVEKSHLLAQII